VSDTVLLSPVLPFAAVAWVGVSSPARMRFTGDGVVSDDELTATGAWIPVTTTWQDVQKICRQISFTTVIMQFAYSYPDVCFMLTKFYAKRIGDHCLKIVHQL